MKNYRPFSEVLFIIIFLLTGDFNIISAQSQQPIESVHIVLENAAVKYSINEKGQNIFFKVKKSDINYFRQDTISYCASLVQGGRGKEYFVASSSIKNNLLKLTFKKAGATSNILITKGRNIFTLVVSGVSGSFESLTFLNVPLKLKGLSFEPFAACVPPMKVLPLPFLILHEDCLIIQQGIY